MSRDQTLLLRKEKAYRKAIKQQSRVGDIHFEITDDDITLLTGPYSGRNVRELFAKGPNERDYVVNNLWFTGDERIEKVIRSLVCK